jgi:hypothetical protein
VYIFSIFSRKFLLNQHASNIVNSYVWAILSNASLKSKVSTHVGVFVSSAFAIVSLIVAMAPYILLSCAPQYWLGCNTTFIHCRILLAIMRDNNLKSALAV